MKNALLIAGLLACTICFGQYRERPVLNTDWKQTLPFDNEQYVYHHGEVFDSPEGFYAVFPDGEVTRIVMGELGHSGDQDVYNGVYECNCITTKKQKGLKSEVTAKQVNEATQKNHGFTYCSIPQIITTLHEGNAQRFESLGLTYSYDALKVEADRRLKIDRQEKANESGGFLGGIAVGLGGFLLGLIIGASAG